MKRIAAIVILFANVNAFAQCTPTLNDAKLDVVSRGLWRGIDLGGPIFAEPEVNVGLCGRPVTTTGNRGVDLTLDAWIPPNRDDFDLYTVGLRHLWYLKDRDNFVAASVREFHWDFGTEPWTTEIAIEARGKITRESSGFTAHPFIEIARDLNRFKGTYARVGIDHEIGAQNIPFQVAVQLYGSVSNYDRTIGFHDAQLSVWAVKRIGSGATRIGVGGGYDRVARNLGFGHSHAWAGVRLQRIHS